MSLTVFCTFQITNWVRFCIECNGSYFSFGYWVWVPVPAVDDVFISCFQCWWFIEWMSLMIDLHPSCWITFKPFIIDVVLLFFLLDITHNLIVLRKVFPFCLCKPEIFRNYWCWMFNYLYTVSILIQFSVFQIQLDEDFVLSNVSVLYYVYFELFVNLPCLD